MPGTVKHKILAALLVAAIFHAPAMAGETVAEPSDYRMEEYRAPVPATLRGAQVVSTKDAADLLEKKQAIFFDVMPHTPKPAKLPAGTIWREKVRKNIPGSIWLPNVGYGAISKDDTEYFRAGLLSQTSGDKTRTILFYCMTDCWMSWNAGKRAIEWGYASVLWYPLGADGWEADGRKLTVGKPFEIK
jgi:PQQ-dependent catabolism-associated CXXCW motif protein